MMEAQTQGIFDPLLNIKHEPEETIIDVVDQQLEFKARIRRKRRGNGISRPFCCDLCEKTYSKKTVLKVHMDRKHCGTIVKGKVKENIFCKLCQKDVNCLRYHLNTFHSDVSHNCDMCSFSTKYPANLMVHKESIHSTLTTYTCSVCSKVFNNQSNRNRHERETHRKTKVAFECHVCSSVSFTRSDNLNLHLRRIHGIRSRNDVVQILPTIMQCDHCPAVYKVSSKSSLIVHMKQHRTKDAKSSGLECRVCFKTFTQKDSLVNHLNGFHLKKYRCKVCQKVLGSRKTLEKHEKRRNCY